MVSVNPFDVSSDDVTPEEVVNEPPVNVMSAGETRQHLEILQEENQLREAMRVYETNSEGNHVIAELINRMESDAESIK